MWIKYSISIHFPPLKTWEILTNTHTKLEIHHISIHRNSSHQLKKHEEMRERREEPKNPKIDSRDCLKKFHHKTTRTHIERRSNKKLIFLLIFFLLWLLLHLHPRTSKKVIREIHKSLNYCLCCEESLWIFQFIL